MTADALAREWTAVGGAALALMGAGLAFGAGRHAADHHSWHRQWRHAAGHEPERRRDGEGAGLARAYRAAGALLALAGAALVAAAASGRAAMRLDLDRAER